jgi:hypothetical protein
VVVVSAVIAEIRDRIRPKPHAELVAKLHKQRALHEEKINQLRRSVEELDELEAQQRRQAIALSPGKRSDVGGATSAPGRTHNRLLDVEKELASHERELAAVWDVIRGEELAAQREHIEERIQEAVAIKATEREAWQTLIAAFNALGNAWLGLAPILQERTVFTNAVRAALLTGAPADLMADWDRAAAPTVTPIPTTFQAMFRLVLDAVCDPGGVGVRVPSALGGIPAAGNLPAIAPERREFAATKVIVADPMVEKRS